MATLSPVRTEPVRAELEKRIAQHDVLILPGWNGSGETHWQSEWERKFPSLRRVHQRDWAEPRPSDWIEAISLAVWNAEAPVLLVAHSLACIAVAHSLACIAVAHWARVERTLARSVRAALLVAPADVEDAERSPQVLRRFAPIPRETLPFTSTMIGSENDPYMFVETARELAADWGSTFVNAGRVGHINCVSGHGTWPEGECCLLTLLRRTGPIEMS